MTDQIPPINGQQHHIREMRTIKAQQVSRNGVRQGLYFARVKKDNNGFQPCKNTFRDSTVCVALFEKYNLLRPYCKTTSNKRFKILQGNKHISSLAFIIVLKIKQTKKENQRKNSKQSCNRQESIRSAPNCLFAGLQSYKNLA